jgi:hypothetical protein
VDTAGDLQVGVILLEGLGGIAEGIEGLPPAELLDVVVHKFGHFIAIVFFELLHALGATASPIVAGTAGDGGVGFGIGIVGLIPEETVHLGVFGELEADVLEIITEGIGVEAGGVQNLAGIGRNLAVMNIVLQKQADLLSAKIFADSPGICNDPQAEIVGGFNDVVNVGEPEIHIKFRDGKDYGIATVLLHLFEILNGVFYIVDSVVTDCCVFDRHNEFSPYIYIFYI